MLSNTSIVTMDNEEAEIKRPPFDGLFDECLFTFPLLERDSIANPLPVLQVSLSDDHCA